MYEEIISLENLFAAWHEFRIGKIKKSDVSEFALDYEDHLFALHNTLVAGDYKYGQYTSFTVHDPKLRRISKAPVVDRVLHHAIVRVIGPLFDRSFIFDSYSSRKTKGTHAATKRFGRFARQLACNNTRTVWILKCDIRKFFDSVDHDMLIALLKIKLADDNLLALLEQIIRSFQTADGKGIPLGNLTSQLFSNIYLNPLDRYVKRVLQMKFYIRYADDFVLMSHDRNELSRLIRELGYFLDFNLRLYLHERKVRISKLHQGIDFLGYVHFVHHIVIRTKTKRRMFKKIKEARQRLICREIDEYQYGQIFQSYLGVLKYCRSTELRWGLAMSS